MPAYVDVELKCDKCTRTERIKALVSNGKIDNTSMGSWMVYSDGDVRCSDHIPNLCLSSRGISRRYWR